jgi:hypothetical protein
MVYPDPIVPYGDMETGAIGVGGKWYPTGWAEYGNDEEILEQDAVNFYVGPHGLHLYNDGSHTSGFNTNRFTVFVGMKIRVRCWLKSAPGNTNKLLGIVKGGDGSTTEISNHNANAIDYQDWTLYNYDWEFSVAGDQAHFRLRTNANEAEWYIDQLTVVEITSDNYFNPDPTGASMGSDIFQNVRGGDTWYNVVSDVFHGFSWDTLNTFTKDTSWDILNTSEKAIAWAILNTYNKNFSWDILNTSTKDTAWDILNTSVKDITWAILNGYTKDFSWDTLKDFDQGTAWSVFARVLYFIQQFFVKAICFNYHIDEPISFSKQIMEPLVWTFNPTGVITETTHLQGEVFDTTYIRTPVTFDFQIKEPTQFTFNVSEVLQGESVEYPGPAD